MVIIKFLIIILILVTVHELGHLVMAKLFKVYVSEFALGFGPKIFSYKTKETEYSVRALPLGGYAAMVGEDGEVDEDHKNIPFERTLKGVNRFKQFLIMFAGSFMNIVLGFVIFCVIAGSQSTISTQPVIGSVEANSPAAKAGLKKDDYVTSIKQGDETTKIKSYTDLRLFSTFNKEGRSYQMNIKRDNKSQTLDIIPEYNKETKTYIAGFSPVIQKASTDPGTILKVGLDNTVDTARNIITSLKMLFTGKAGVDNLSGPVGIVKHTQEISDNSGIWGLINFTALLSINLAIFNLLPVPALDGGRILIILIESITRRRINPDLEGKIIGGSFILLMGLIIFVTYNDIIKMFFK